MKLVILIPYYKNSPECETQFKKLMKTLVKQIGGNIDIIICEDGQYSEWIRSYTSNIIVNKINKGVAFARNQLLLRASEYDYIMFLDSDDMIDCDFICKMYEAADTNKYDMIISRFIYQGKEVIYPTRCNVAGICLRTDFIKGIMFNEEYNISEDTLFINEVYARNPNIFIIDSNYYYNYGINPNSLMMRFERSELKLKKDDNNE